MTPEAVDVLLDQITELERLLTLSEERLSLAVEETDELRLADVSRVIAITACQDLSSLWKEQAEAYQSDARWSKFWQYIGLGIGGVGIAWGASQNSSGPVFDPSR